MKKRTLPLLVLLLLSAALPLAAQGDSQTATVIFDTAFLRQEPSLDAPVVAEAARGDTLTITTRTADGAWLGATLADGSLAWLPNYLVDLSGSAADLPPAAETADPQVNEVIVPPGCDYFNIGPFFAESGQSIILMQGWEAASRNLVEQYRDNVLQVVSFDGRIISTYASYASDIVYDEGRDTYQIFWRFDMGPVSAGEHVTEWTQIYSGTITDGLDADGDGQPDSYGPDAVTYTCTLIVE